MKSFNLTGLWVPNNLSSSFKTATIIIHISFTTFHIQNSTLVSYSKQYTCTSRNLGLTSDKTTLLDRKTQGSTHYAMHKFSGVAATHVILCY